MSIQINLHNGISLPPNLIISEPTKSTSAASATQPTSELDTSIISEAIALQLRHLLLETKFF